MRRSTVWSLPPQLVCPGCTNNRTFLEFPNSQRLKMCFYLQPMPSLQWNEYQWSKMNGTKNKTTMYTQRFSVPLSFRGLFLFLYFQRFVLTEGGKISLLFPIKVNAMIYMVHSRNKSSLFNGRFTHKFQIGLHWCLSLAIIVVWTRNFFDLFHKNFDLFHKNWFIS